jgi:lysophospholipase L1-like esterase
MHLRSVILPLVLVVAAFAPPRPVTLFLAGDSTMAEKKPEKRPETGWGEKLSQYFRDGEVRIVNKAANGRSTRTFIGEGKWREITDSLREGDWVFIQFGHNDESVEKVDRYTPPADFKRNLAVMVAEVRAKHASPVLLTPVRRRKFDASGALVDTHGEYPDLTRAVARELSVPLLDMHASSAAVLTRYGADSSAKLFLQVEPGETPNYPTGVHDNTHFRPLGAEEMARVAVEGIRSLRLGLASYLKAPAATRTSAVGGRATTGSASW